MSRDESARILFATSGTMGQFKIIGLSFDEMLLNCQVHGTGYRAGGIQPQDRVVTFGLPAFLNSEFTVYLSLAETGCMIIPIGGFYSPNEIINACEDLDATVLLVMPSELIPVLDELEKSQRQLSKIRLVMTGGEALWPAIVERAKAAPKLAQQILSHVVAEIEYRALNTEKLHVTSTGKIQFFKDLREYRVSI